MRDLRRSAGLTQRDLAYRVAVGFPHISKIEAGRERPSLGLCRSIAQVLSVSGDHLAARFGYLPDWADELLEPPAPPGPKPRGQRPVLDL